ncbi:hypothetical protein Tco_0757223, partial [Tanacetum coccineum]
MADYIPLKLQAEIMKRLPVISLIRFRTLLKTMKSLDRIAQIMWLDNTCHPGPHSVATSSSSSSVKLHGKGGVLGSIGLIKRAVIWNPSIKKIITIVVPNDDDDDDDVVDDDDDPDL